MVDLLRRELSGSVKSKQRFMNREITHHKSHDTLWSFNIAIENCYL